MGHQKQVNHVAFSPDGLYVASSGYDNHVKLWNSRDGKFIATLRGHVGPVYMTCFSPDSRLLVSGSKDCTLKVWDVRSKCSAVSSGIVHFNSFIHWFRDRSKICSLGLHLSIDPFENLR